MTKYKRRFGDRYDGRRIRSLDPFYRIVPFIMRYRSDSQNFFEEKIEIGHAESYLRKRRKSTGVKISMLHVMIAAMVRTIALRPALNRFIAGQNIYARNEILVSLAIKKEMKVDSPETTVKFKFEPTDTLSEIAQKINRQIEENKVPDTKNDTDKVARLFMLCPGLLVKLLVFLIRSMDYLGIMPKVIHRVSPFHTSFFITDLGSIGIQPIYHHLYDFGTTSIFIAFGIKTREKVIDSNNEIKEKRFIKMKVATDERIVDGHYYASAFKLYKALVQNPERLEVHPGKLEPDIE
ncbi:MAG: 2-oxo acid dehydrogenase subunit E2 [Clostridiaceae bacterium]|nr:2-oxo acid dehydrogenase subunit E2 [Clostridiaceae bacterium]